jgi:hypothetical protein
MANLTVLPIQQIGPLFKCESTRIITAIVGASGFVAGYSYYLDPTTGTFLPTSTLTSGLYQFRGLALETGGKGQGLDILQEGYVGGYDLSALNYDALVYLSDTVGQLSSTAGTNTVIVGRVCAVSDRDPVTGLPSKVLFVSSNMRGNW